MGPFSPLILSICAESFVLLCISSNRESLDLNADTHTSLFLSRPKMPVKGAAMTPFRPLSLFFFLGWVYTRLYDSYFLLLC